MPSTQVTAQFTSDEARWQAVQSRNRQADGHFVYAVKTTGVYCRPSSSARQPQRKNVVFFDTAQQVEAAGHRPSRRAHADRTAAADERAELVARACRQIESAQTPPSLDELAVQANMSPFHFHRIFKAETGVTPKAYASAWRARKLRDELGAAGTSITDAIYSAGFNSNSRF